MRPVRAVLSVSSLLLVASGAAAQGTCGPCPFPGACPPTFPMGAGPGEQHACEYHAFSALAGVDLSLADLSAIDLEGTDLSGADLSGASLVTAHAAFTSFRDADLSGADLSSAYVAWADFSGADLSNTTFSGVVNTAYYDCDTILTGSSLDPAFWGWVNTSPCGSCVSATETVRLGSTPNPDALRPGQTHGPVLGELWDPVIDHAAFFPAATFDVLLISLAAPIDVATPFGTLLCDPGPASLLYSTSAGTPFGVPIPLECSLLGAAASTQGAGLSLGPLTLQLANGLDLTIGSH